MKRRNVNYQQKSSWWGRKEAYDKRVILVAISVIAMLLILNKQIFAALKYIEQNKLEIIDFTQNVRASVVIRPKTDYLVIHHAAGEKYLENDSALLKSIEADHISKGYKTIAYHYVIIGKKIYQCHKLDEKIAGVEDYNSCTVNVCVIGDFNKRKPTLEEEKSLKGLIYQLKTKDFSDAEICYHKTLNCTSCCGQYLIENIEPYIKTLNEKKSWTLTQNLTHMLKQLKNNFQA